jgi:beta-galactosidase
VTVEAVDAEGRPDLRADQQVQFTLGGPGAIAAVGNGDGQDPDSYQGDQRKLYQGRALVVIRTSKQTGPITLTVKSTGLGDGSLTIDTKASKHLAELQ